MHAGKENVLQQKLRSADDVCINAQTAAIVIVGTGPVGMQFVNELLQRGLHEPIIVYGSEPVQAYNRVRLSDYLAGVLHRDELTIVESCSQYNNIEYRYNCAVEWINKSAQTITDISGRVQRYSKLVLATGSTAFMPMIGNRQYRGIYALRTLREADELLSRKLRTRHTVVIGGGMLGLEIAAAMQKFNTEVTIIEHSRWLMMKQLDEQAARYLQQSVTASGIDIIFDDSVVSATGNRRVEGLTLRSGRNIVCDTLIVAAGVRPNVLLAKEAGLVCHKGIMVNNYLETSYPNIYAIGECAEHQKTVYGLVRPGFEQAAVLADRLGGGDAEYIGSIASTQLKVMSQAVFSAGRNGVDEAAGNGVSEYIYSNRKAGVYRKIRVFGNRIIGCIAVGEWHESALVNEAIIDRRNVWLWNLLRFRVTGSIWGGLLKAIDASVATDDKSVP